MRLKVSGIGKIGNSEIEMNGITVIAGDNNTGKSTFGKALYCMFNVFNKAELMIRNERINHIEDIIHNSEKFPYYTESSLSKLVKEMMESRKVKLSEEDIQKSIIDAITILERQPKETIDPGLVDKIKGSFAIRDEDIQKKLIDRYFKIEFQDSINHLNRFNSKGNICIIIQRKDVYVNIQNNECNDFSDDIGICHKAIYIDTPLVLDDIRETRIREQLQHFPEMVYNHRQVLKRRLAKRYSNNNVLEEVMINEKISDILLKLSFIANGEFKEDNRGLMFMENGLNKPVPLSGISTGIKTFLIIKRLLELGEIKERDVLILDEPEIHLHPSWQLQFAELLVLLQKEFNLTILLNTHSPYFLYAIEAYGKKHDIENRLNFYLAENDGDISNVREVTDSIDTIYKQLAAPFQKLEDLIYED
ncbi:MAG: ATP-binding protein [Chitinispirillales bacterium]|jgi:ABC-type cobalamin/Fe3+-siderophores transport system ATPase subunit|nr:ATP-binding protein [Chitinispirillales bacterium]